MFSESVRRDDVVVVWRGAEIVPWLYDKRIGLCTEGDKLLSSIDDDRPDVNDRLMGGSDGLNRFGSAIPELKGVRGLAK